MSDNTFTVYCDITNGCNLQCIFCPRNNTQIRFMQPEDFALILEKLCGKMHSFILGCGWECTLSPYLPEVLSIVKDHAIPFTVMYTHGNNLREELITSVINARINDLVISFSAAKKETYERIYKGGSFEKVVSVIKRIRDIKETNGTSLPRICVNLSLLQSVLMELPDFVDLAHDIGIEQIRGRKLILNEGIHIDHEVVSDYEAADRLIETACKKAAIYGIEMNLPTYAAPPSKHSKPCQETASRLYINYKGNVSACPRIHMYENFGNLIEQDFKAAIYGKAAQDFKKRFVNKNFHNPVCSLCVDNLEYSVPINQGF